MPALVKTLRRWNATVRGEIQHCAATSLLDIPEATSWAILSSVGVSATSVDGSRLRAVSPEARSSWLARAATAYGNAMTGETGQDENFQLALSSYAASGRSFDQARAELAYGEWLRRSQRRVDARAHLRIALETFLDVRAETLAERANQELRASGETARKRDPSTLVKLTPMELKIAQLVSSGLSNKDVAAQCWVSPRTVAFHLRNVFAKAGITSRGELAQLDLG